MWTFRLVFVGLIVALVAIALYGMMDRAATTQSAQAQIAHEQAWQAIEIEKAQQEGATQRAQSSNLTLAAIVATTETAITASGLLPVVCLVIGGMIGVWLAGRQV